MIVWRVTAAGRESSALSGEGSRLNGGRWNPKGFPVVYTAPSIALGALEIVVHAGLVTVPYVAIELDVPDDLIVPLSMTGAPPDWARRDEWCRAQGRLWVESGTHLGMAVPSAVLGDELPEWNLVLNVNHPDFAKVVRLRTFRLWLDERLTHPSGTL